MTQKALADSIRLTDDLSPEIPDSDVIRDVCACPNCLFELDADEIAYLVWSAVDESHFDRLVTQAIREKHDCSE